MKQCCYVIDHSTVNHNCATTTTPIQLHSSVKRKDGTHERAHETGKILSRYCQWQILCVINNPVVAPCQTPTVARSLAHVRSVSAKQQPLSANLQIQWPVTPVTEFKSLVWPVGQHVNSQTTLSREFVYTKFTVNGLAHFVDPPVESTFSCHSRAQIQFHPRPWTMKRHTKFAWAIKDSHG